jgi:UDP-N-acetylglucosamine:LPS N-acetylglucosamine transferase
MSDNIPQEKDKNSHHLLSVQIHVISGQEEGNVDFVLEHRFGEYQSDNDPPHVAQLLCSWLQDMERLHEMSQGAMKAGNPHAAEYITRRIGTSVLRWKELHPEEQENVLNDCQTKEIQEQEMYMFRDEHKSEMRYTLNSQISQASC